jgi:HrpA-like RNA helicase
MREGRAQLLELGATHRDGTVTEFGRQIARLAAHPKLASMIIG